MNQKLIEGITKMVIEKVEVMNRKEQTKASDGMVKIWDHLSPTPRLLERS
jgi:hypothetical protein